MASAIVTFVVESIGNLLLEEAKFLRGVKGEVERLQSELVRMQCFLKDADVRQESNETIRNWVAEIRDLAYDAEDIVESYVIRVASMEEAAGLKKAFKRTIRIPKDGISVHNDIVGLEVAKLTSQISELTTSLQTYGVREYKYGNYSPNPNPNSSSERQQVNRQTYRHIAKEYIVGLETDTDILVSQLLSMSDSTDKHNCCTRVVSIWGMGGLGKTTLAKQVFHNYDEVRTHFSCFAWTYISQQLRARDVWEEILIRIASPRERWRISELMDDEVAEELSQVLMKKRCLVVLDNIWSEDAWDCLRAGFPTETTSESIILLTTRHKGAALHVDPNCFLHQPRRLNEAESWELFLKVAVYGRVNTTGLSIFDEGLEKLGRGMVDKCAGLPLAVKALGGILATKNATANDWSLVYDGIKSCLRSKNGEIKEVLEVAEALSLSYLDLPYPLKQCFMYLSQFPEEYKIPTTRVINMWVAEGIIIQKGSSTNQIREEELEDVAYKNLEELVLRRMVRVEEAGSTGRIRSFSIHDLMRDLCIQEAEKENFFNYVFFENGGNYYSDEEDDPNSPPISSSP